MNGPGVAVLGTGNIALAHTRALVDAGANVLYVFGSDLARATRVAALAPGSRPSTELDQVLADHHVTGVVICGRTRRHAQTSIAAASAGKHLLVEKPPAMNLGDFDEAVTAATSAGVTYMVGQVVRHQPAIATIARQVEEGTIGDVGLVHVIWHTGYVWPGGWRAWQLDSDQSGGVLVHNGMHPLDLAIWLFGDEPQRVFARGWRTFAPDTPVSESFHVTVRFQAGGIALLEMAYGLPRAGDTVRRIFVAGDSGTLQHSTEGETSLHSDRLKPEPVSIAGAMEQQARHWLDVVAGVVPPLVSVSESRLALRAALAAQESLASRRAVEL